MNSRTAQRKRTEERILTVARRLFARQGYDRTTIRAVAGEAGIDPGLVIRYFGNKENLFAHAARMESEDPLPANASDVATLLLDSLGDKLAGEPVSVIAMLRSMLTHPEAGREVLAFMTDQQRQIAKALPQPDAALRADLLGAITMGMLFGRYLIKLEVLQDASPEEIIDLLRPCFHALAEGGD
ncbi:TetR/AcrR family transcriptional regulator [Amycolatopsis pithecellobii]|uniref:TetR family transcriptional regulator n=1 Tax=Amycolatopsis pithecellobii TaxID=664692 RepID=A0A6N7ZAV7_9PSEU|nr:TetR/AcrR family transcriptional regulator [Amycolatopsis pithecellobii]MTD58849.1 TetR family transcriptional regulator [Amycolatopsis pithecellobii]